jgi:hypothetical protein
MEPVKRSDWDLDLRFGEEGENTVRHLIETAEVKTDRRWKETGNLYLETQCFSHNNQEWYPSGISTTKASHWAFNLEGTIVIVPTINVKKAIQRFGRRIQCEIPPNYSVGFLLKVENLLDIARRN